MDSCSKEFSCPRPPWPLRPPCSCNIGRHTEGHQCYFLGFGGRRKKPALQFVAYILQNVASVLQNVARVFAKCCANFAKCCVSFAKCCVDFANVAPQTLKCCNKPRFGLQHSKKVALQHFLNKGSPVTLIFFSCTALLP